MSQNFIAEINVPILESFDLDVNSIIRKAANAAANTIRKRLKSGVDGSGMKIPQPTYPGAKDPLDQTGQLIKSIKAGAVRNKSSTIFPRGYHDTQSQHRNRRDANKIGRLKAKKGVSGKFKASKPNSGKSNAEIAFSLAKHQGINIAGIQGSEENELQQLINDEIARQLKNSPTGGLIVNAFHKL